MRIALIAHDNKKPKMMQFAMKHKDILSGHKLCGTGTTGSKISEATSLKFSLLVSLK